MPGPEPPLTDAQCKQAFYDAMPHCWQEKFEQTGHNFNDMAISKVVQYFRTLEKAAQRAMAKNTQKQHREAKHCSNNGKGSKQPAGTSKPTKCKQEQEEELPDNIPCPRHPKGNHTNGECRQNPKNKKFSHNNKRSCNGNGNGKTDGHMAKMKNLTINDDEGYDSDTTIGFIEQYIKACQQEEEKMLSGTLN
jgi:hypothetical protein